MKKTILICVLTAAVVLGLCACGGEKTITGDGGNNTQQAAGGGSVAAAGGYIFTSGGTGVEIDSKMEEVLNGLGEPKSYFESESCAFGDLDKVYTYSGFRIDTYQLDGVDYVLDVIFTDDTVSTPEGAAIGDSADRVKELYGEPTQEDDLRLLYEKDNMKLIFILDGGTVTTIEYLSKVLDS